MSVDHEQIVKKFEEEMNNSLKSPLESLLTKKRLVMNASAIFNFLKAIDPYKKIMSPR